MLAKKPVHVHRVRKMYHKECPLCKAPVGELEPIYPKDGSLLMVCAPCAKNNTTKEIQQLLPVPDLPPKPTTVDLIVAGKNLYKSRKHCVVCHVDDRPLERAHLLSKRLADVIVEKQLGTRHNFSKGILRSLSQATRRYMGTVWLCSTCHRYSDRTQDHMEALIDMLVIGPDGPRRKHIRTMSYIRQQQKQSNGPRTGPRDLPEVT